MTTLSEPPNSPVTVLLLQLMAILRFSRRREPFRKGGGKGCGEGNVATCVPATHFSASTTTISAIYRISKAHPMQMSGLPSRFMAKTKRLKRKSSPALSAN